MKFLVFHDSLGEDGMPFEAVDHEHAAEKFAEYYDRDDYPLAQSQGRTCEYCEVHQVGDPSIIARQFKIWAEPRVEYYASEVTDE